MTRLNLATDLKTRIGASSTKDARQVNSYVEVKGDQTVVRKRPAAQGGIAVGTGTPQGGIGLTINGTPYFIGFWGDVLYSYSGSGTSWSSTTGYTFGDHVSFGFVDYWALADNLNSQPSFTNSNWSRNYAPARYQLPVSTITGISTSSVASPTVYTYYPTAGNAYISSQLTTYTTIVNGLYQIVGTISTAGSGYGSMYPWPVGILPSTIVTTYTNIVWTEAQVAANAAAMNISYTPGGGYYYVSGTTTYHENVISGFVYGYGTPTYSYMAFKLK